MADAGEQADSQTGLIWELCQQEKEEAEKSLSLTAVTKDGIPTALIKDGWHYHRDLPTESKTSAL